MSVVIIPAYKPDETLLTITDRLWVYGCRIIVVDDGSGVEYKKFFEKISDICIILHHSENRGKGAAVKTALTYIQQELWENQVIGIMDADGQHLPEDMIKLLNFAGTHSKSLVLGVREVGKDMPLKSRIGNKITRMIFQWISGVRISDTQTGLRAFTSELLQKMCLIKGERYEYEMNVLLDIAKAGIPIEEIPIETIYRDEKNSTSHFRVIQDSIRIYKDLLKFTASSLSSFVLDYFLFTFFVFLFPEGTIPVLLANIAARIISAFYNYSVNCRFVFHTDRQFRTAADYFMLAGVILILNNVILEAFLTLFYVPVYGAKLATECILFLLSWLIQNKVIFRKRKALPFEMKKDVNV